MTWQNKLDEAAKRHKKRRINLGQND